MVKNLLTLTAVLLLATSWPPAAWGQTSATSGDTDDSSTRVEQREDSYRRQMELEDARTKNRAYVDTTYTESAEQEKIDKLPPGSRENIRDQLVDIIMENGEWEPGDVFGEYPYQPTEAAEDDAELMEQELAAWEEQVEKYHQREAEAFGVNRGPVPGPGNPTGQQGGGEGDGSEGAQGSQGDGSRDQQDTNENTAGTYQPGSQASDDAASTAGVSESALDFLMGSKGQSRAGQPPQPSGRQADDATPDEPSQVAELSTASNTESSEESPQDPAAEVSRSVRGIIAIEDLDKLEGTQTPAPADDSGKP